MISELLRRDLLQLKRSFWSKFFDIGFVFFTNLVVFAYFMPQNALGENYGSFILIGSLASFGLFETVGKVYSLISDIDGDRTISYTLTLPIPSWLVFAYIGIYWTINSILVTLLLLPLGKLILFKEFDLSLINWPQYIVMYLSIYVFFGFFSLWMAALLKKMGDVEHLWIRVINPLFMFGAFFYTWNTLNSFSPILSYISLANPMVYAMEGLRAASLGEGVYLPFWACLLFLWTFTIACALHAIYCLRKRLDCV